MAGGGSPGDRSLKETPTWAVATVCAVFVIISILIEQGIHFLGKWFQKRNKKALNEALEKIKAELMLLGFISLLLTVGSKPISMICITVGAGNTMLPCKKQYSDPGYDKDDRRKLLWANDHQSWHRVLAATGGGSDYCSRHNKVPLVSQSGMNQLHIFIFVLAVFHVLYSVITMALGRAKMKRWQKWESETSSLEYQFTNDPSRFRFAHQTSFVRRHASFSARTPGLRWIVAFFRQFFGSVTKVDYLTLRHGFINAHFAPNSKFDFHKYIKRSLEDDFKVVVGISFPLWIFATLFLLLNVYGWYTLLWISFIPLIILLLIGTKLEVIIMELALQIQERTAVVKGAPTVEPSDKFFWFNRPEWILFLLHFTLFQNAFQMAFFLWIWYQFGLTSCFNENLPAILVRVVMGLALQVVCSYITFPLYALVTQMGSHMKKAIFEEQTAKALRKWQKAAKERKKLRKGGADVPSGIMSGETTPSQGSSPIHLLHKYRFPTGDTESVLNSPRSYPSDNEFSEMEAPPLDSHEVNIKNSTFRERDAAHSGDFSFVQP